MTSVIILLGRGFVDKYYELSREKDSFLCVGIDPAFSDMRERFVMPDFLIRRHGVEEGIKRFSIELVEAVAPYAPVIKPNAQFVTYPFSLQDIEELVEAIHEGGCLALLDCKLTDIGSTNEAGLFWIDRVGFDAITFSPFQGFENGSDAVYKWAGENDKGIFALCRMSNPGAHDYQSREVEGDPLYLRLAREAYEHGSNGFVVGCTAPSELGKVRAIIGDERLILSPGLGPQGGDPSEALRKGANGAGEGLLVSSSRSIDYAYSDLGWGGDRFAEAAAFKARVKRDELNEIKSTVLK
jgi:orotidine 5'-phosphate decarboxylase subfamily 2